MALDVFNPNSELSLGLTDTAANFFRKKLSNTEAVAIRLSVKKSGCTGYAYVIDTVNQGEDGDTEIVLKDITFHVSEKAKSMINGSEIDLVTQGLNKTISFNNPNVTASCGCGSSFSID
ncbi:MAG: iron-sulfur cluster assembly accessory protein [Gammaproteobacteria bacterium]|nr:iron-sulfur cluster assembly accessory protein [Gammaproteobacteria bacterium]